MQYQAWYCSSIPAFWKATQPLRHIKDEGFCKTYLLIYKKIKKFPSYIISGRYISSLFFQATVALSGLVAAASAAPEAKPWVVAGPVIAPALVDPHATSGMVTSVISFSLLFISN